MHAYLQACTSRRIQYPIGVYLIGIYLIGCEGKPGVYATIWYLCYRTSKLKKRKKKGALSLIK
jgi:hypothetical protein